MKSSIRNSLILFILSSVSAQVVTSCYRDPTCLAKISQYVILGTVVSNTLNQTGSSLANYNASIAVKCAFISFTENGPDPGNNLAGYTIDVTGFGGGNKCPSGVTHAEVNATQLFFIHVR
jgi:hypothetical protein